MIAFAYRSKKELKENIGKPLRYIETSLFDLEYMESGIMTGVVSFHPDKILNSFAPVPMKDGLIWKVI